MAFSEAVKLSAKRKAHFKCCICQRPSVSLEAHHIIPEADGGPDTEDNAAPLCPTCHAEYGANPEKRTAIRVQRDFWYEICERRYAPDADRSERLIQLLEGLIPAVPDFRDFLYRKANSPMVIEAPAAAAHGAMGIPTVLVGDHAHLSTADHVQITTIEQGMVTVEEDDDSSPLQEFRTEPQILEALERFYDQHYYHLHQVDKGRIVSPEILQIAVDIAESLEAKYKDDPEALGPLNDYQWGILNGKLAALRWVLGDEWYPLPD